MGYTTDVIGHFDITPALNAAEAEYLTAFARSRRWDRPEGPYAVPGNPYAPDDAESQKLDAYHYPPAGQPELRCQWVPCGDGECLAWDGQEKFYEPVAWLRYLIAHFLSPGAAASRVKDPQFAGFTFDHVVSGVVAACRRDTHELRTIVAVDNRVRTRVLRRGDPQSWQQPMPYETENDRWHRTRPRPNRNLVPDDGTMEVVDLADRRRG